ncbi:MAG: hypothetical protein LBD94_02545 [Rickettsiales bacterium]|jgi:hypothetical protein|nr:hypothetical protein [Rickettsiales bacterium]
MRKTERFLISILWLNSVAIAALWIFNTIFGFNLLAINHWRYLSELQLAGRVEAKFYIFLAVFAIAGLVGLYMLIVPWHRRIRIQGPSDMLAMPVAEKMAPPAATQNDVRQMPDLSRPPKLNLNSVFIPTRRESFELPPDSENQIFRESSAARQIARPEIIDKIKNMMIGAGFVIKDAPSVGGTRLDLWAIGTDEAIVAGLICNQNGEIIASEGGDSMWRASGRAFKSPVWTMTAIVQKLQALFLKVIGAELKVSLLPFVFVDGGTVSNKDEVRKIWDALGIKVFDNIDVFGDFLAEYKPRPLDEFEKEDFESFSEFVDTVAVYFNGES